VEDTTRSCATAPFNKVGACALDTAVCESGQWVGCAESKGDDSCEAGNDNNCNGTPNEGCACVDGTVQECGHPEVGVCKPGTSSCEGSQWGPCVGNIDPGERDCSSADDNDCDGSPDNTLDEACGCEVGLPRACDEHAGLDGNGRCQAGSQTCILSEDKTTSDWGGCSGSVGPASADTCDPGNDDNCNGDLNEGCPCVNGDTQPCGHATVGICKRGTSTCENSEWQPCEGNIEPKPRDCSSALDNDCDGSDDDTKDAVCECAVGGAPQACGTHPGLDGNGPCKAGSQSCVLATDKTSSYWGSCSGSVGPAGSDTCNPDNDNNCNGAENEGCSCVNGTSINCECGGTVTCTNGMIPSCSQVPVLRYRDSDGDSFGNPSNSSMVCPGTSGWVTNSNDCDDGDGTIYPNNAVECASDQMTREWCPSSGGVLDSEYCDEGCYEGDCRGDGTVGVPGFVSCQQDTPLTYCPVNAGCDAYETTCGTTGTPGTIRCDGPNDCPGQACCAKAGSFSLNAVCMNDCPSDQFTVCDPLENICSCTRWFTNGAVGIYVCPEGV
jgi:hypothetical protein